MVVGKGVEVAAVAHQTVHMLDGVSDLKVVVVVVAGVNALVAFVVCDRVKHILVGDSVVVAVGDLAVKPEIGLFASAKSMLQNLCVILRLISFGKQ